ncbi:MAG: hypothetical protein HOP19_15390 [Acidobacteria bacterium]|nr:hypothetical protein [Acidobacteriota bacterium]
MRKSSLTVLSLCFSLVLSQAALPAITFASVESNTRPRIVRNAPLPIGTLETQGSVSINGRALQGRQAVWNGELIQATTPVAVALPTLGKINLGNGGAVQISKTESAEQHTLLASVYEGEAEISVAPTANAYLEAGGKTWVASGATLLKLSMKSGQPVLEARRGHVQPLGNWALNLANVAVPVTKVIAEETAVHASLLRSIKQITRPVGSDAPSELRLFANARASMLGMIESSGTLKLNGRAARSQELLWNGELIQTENAEARVALHGLARVNIARDASARLSIATEGATAADGVTARRVLMGNLLHGEMTVRLDANVAAYVETQGKTFAAEPGAHFRLSEQAGQVTLEIKAGSVREITNVSVNTTTGFNDETTGKTGASLYVVRPADKGGYLQNVKPGESQTLRFLVTDRAGKPAAALPVVFSLNAADEQAVGTLGVGVEARKQFATRTDAQGIAVVPFNAGRTKGSTSITAVVAESAPSNSNVVVVNTAKDEGFWTKRNAIPVFAIVGAAVAAGIVVGLTRDEPLPIQGRGGATIVP